MKIFVIQYPKL